MTGVIESQSPGGSIYSKYEKENIFYEKFGVSVARRLNLLEIQPLPH